ncbi:TetR/AcrR family transcriptional regulator [Nakamurella deserti]|uniref:TetR/AcrR family transcriptional regulator n=1 Tax=Nakamurella deserti TaxID=2164074 RepID=UPI000DBE1FFE|nr:TetR/AcrR family transcriptional regulator [Nakamurella deserti]
MGHHQTEATTSDAVAVRILDAAVAVINRQGVTETTIAAICAESGIDHPEFDARFGSVNDVLVQIIAFITQAYGDAMAATARRRRSLYESVRLAHQKLLDVAEEHRDFQSALMAIRLAAMTDRRIGVPTAATRSLQEELIARSEDWLEDLARLHNVTWELPTRLLATFMSVSLTGVLVDYLARQDMTASRSMVDLIAFDLAHRGRRMSKNSSY